MPRKSGDLQHCLCIETVADQQRRPCSGIVRRLPKAFATHRPCRCALVCAGCPGLCSTSTMVASRSLTKGLSDSLARRAAQGFAAHQPFAVARRSATKGLRALSAQAARSCSTNSLVVPWPPKSDTDPPGRHSPNRPILEAIS